MRSKGEGTLGPVKQRWTLPDGTPRESTSWRAGVTLDDGRRVFRQARTKAEAKALLAELLKLRDARTVDGSRLRLRAYLEGWLDDVRPNLAPATWNKHEQHIRNHIVAALGHRRLSELSVADVRRFLLVDGARVHPQTARHHRSTLRRALADAVRDGLVTRNVAALAEPPKLDTKERPVLTAEQARTLIEGTAPQRLPPGYVGPPRPGDRYHALWTLLVTTGLREAEALALTWEDIDLGPAHRDGLPDHPRLPDPAVRDVAQPDDGDRAAGAPRHAEARDGRDGGVPQVRVHRTLHRVPRTADTPGRWEFRTTKTAKSRRTVFLPAVTVEALRQHRARQMERWLAAGKPGDGQMVFTDTKGRPVHGSKLTEILYPVLDGLGLPRVTIHDLRHSSATILYGAGVPLEAIADMLGHSTTRVTSDLYRHRVQEVQRQAADAMQEAIG